MPVPLFSNRFPVTTEETTPEMEEQSGEGSGNSDMMNFLRDGPEKELNTIEEEATSDIEGSGDIDYSNFVYPEEKHELSAADLENENMLQ